MYRLPSTDGSESRRAERQNVDVACKVSFDRRVIPARIADISMLGARLAGAGLPAVGEEILLTTCGMEIVATVTWQTDSACGTVFNRRLSQSALDTIARAPTRRDKFWKLVAESTPDAG